MQKYILMGVQGCGKGTQAKMLVEDFGLVHISVGDLFRWNIQNKTKLAAKVKKIMAAGNLVPDEITLDLMRQRLDQHDWNHGFILDGFPRNPAQAEFLLEGYDIDAVILIDVPDEVVMERISNRRLCQICGRDYNLLFSPPSKENTCDCGGNLAARPDDEPEAISKRLADYHNETEPVLELLGRKETIVKVDGTRKPAEIQAEIRSKLGLE